MMNRNLEIKTRGQARLFRNPILEFLTKTSPLAVLILHLTTISVLFGINFYYGLITNPLKIAGIFAGGFLSWTLTEYLFHRYVFHFVSENKTIQRVVYLMHVVHHEYPLDTQRVFMPPVPAVFVAAFFFGMFYLVMGEIAFAFFPGFLAGYLAYVFIHYGIHSRKPPKLLRYTWKHHNLHHYKYPDKAFGVSSPLWDHVFGTMPPVEK